MIYFVVIAVNVHKMNFDKKFKECENCFNQYCKYEVKIK